MFAKSMAEYLSSQGYGKQDVTLFVNNFPSRAEMPDSIAVYDASSYSVRGRARNSVNFRCQIRVRGVQEEDTAQKILNIYNLLEKEQSIKDSNGKRFVIQPLNPPSFLMYDEAGRANWILNVSSIAYNY